MLLVSKYVVTSHTQSVISRFCIISFSKLVNVIRGDERAFDQKLGTLSVPGDLHFWDLVNAFFSSSKVMFPHFRLHTCSFPLFLEDFILLVEFVMFINHLSLYVFTCIFCFSSCSILGISMTFVILYFLITFLAFLVFVSLLLSISLKYRYLSSDRFNFLFSNSFPLRFSFLFQFNSKLRFNWFCTSIQHCNNIILT